MNYEIQRGRSRWSLYVVTTQLQFQLFCLTPFPGGERSARGFKWTKATDTVGDGSPH